MYAKMHVLVYTLTVIYKADHSNAVAQLMNHEIHMQAMTQMLSQSV